MNSTGSTAGESSHYRRRVVVASAVGLHARPAALLAKAAAGTARNVRIGKVVDGEVRDHVDASSVLGLMTLGAQHGDEVELVADGNGEAVRAAVDTLADMVATDLDAETPATTTN